MRRSSFLVAVLAAALCAALAASPADAAPAADATQGAGASPVADGVAPNAAPPVPSPLPTLALSDKPGPGCCCIRTGPGKAPACSDGLQEGPCKSAARAVAGWSATWTEGKCKQP